MASTERLKSGKYRGIYYISVGGKSVKQRVPGTFEYERDAQDAADEARVKALRRAAVKKGTQSPRIKWGDWWELVTEGRTTDADTPRTEKNIVEAYLRPRWGDTPVNEMPQDDIQTWVNELALGLHVRSPHSKAKRPSPSYVHRVFGVLSMSMGLLVPKVLDANPCVGVDLPRVSKKAKPYMTTARLDVLRPHLREDYQDAVEFQLETGVRPGELCGLHANRIDFDTGLLTVCEVYVLHRKTIKTYPKDDDVRVVPLTKQALEIARRRLGSRDTSKGCGLPHTDGSACDSPLVFVTARGRPMNQDTYGKALHRAASKAKVDRRTPYANRRGFATRAAEGGANAFELAEWMGHSDVRQTKDYVQQTSAARDRLRAALGERTNLVVIDGERGTDRGTAPDPNLSTSDPIEPGQNTG